MTGLLLALAVVAAVVAVGGRRVHRHRLRRAAAGRAGASPERAIVIRAFSEMDAHLQQRWCHCGGYLEAQGEGTREHEGRRLRVARLRCQECERDTEVYFDTTDLLH